MNPAGDAVAPHPTTSVAASMVGAASHAVANAARWESVLLARTAAARLVVALVPAAQVLTVGWLVGRADGPARGFVAPLALLTALVGLSQMVIQLSNLDEQRLRNRLQFRYQDQLLRAIAAMPPQRLGEPRTTALIQACRLSLFDLGRLVNSVVQALAVFVSAASLCAAVWRISPLAALLVIGTLVPSLLIFAWDATMQHRELAAHGEAQRRAEYVTEQLISQRTATELTTLGSGAVVADLATQCYRTTNAIMDRILLLLTRSGLVGGLSTALLLGAALAAIVLGGAGGAGIAAGVIGVISGMNATRGAGFAAGDLMSITPEMAEFRELVGSAPLPHPVQIGQQVDEIGVDDLSITYPGSATPAVQGVSIRARRGQTVALVGVNGAGKSTVVNALLGVVDHQGGRITIDGQPADQLALPQRLGNFGLLTQEFGRYEFTVREAVLLGRPGGQASDEELWAALDAARIRDVVRGLPGGLDAQLGQQFGGVGLSGGQWQRLALARIHLRGAPVWVLDEPTSAIDAEAEREIFTELQRTKADRITVVVSHRAWTLKGMDHIYVLDEGRLVEQGTFEQLMANRGRFAEIFADQLD